MGNWRNRPPRRLFYNQRRPSYDYPESPPHSRFVEDGVPSWEKGFCSSIGSVPWQKIVNAKKFMYCHGSILNWNDSAGEEAFHNAKKRFWSEINGFPCDIPLPDPDMFIDEVNWNSNVDSELIKDLEKALFVPDEDEKDPRLWRRNKKKRNFAAVPSDGCYRNPGDITNPWECKNTMTTSLALKDKPHGWSQLYTNTNNSSNVNSSDNPWEQATSHGNAGAKGNAWGDSADKLCGWNCSASAAVKGNTWEDCGDKLFGWSHSRIHVDKSRDWDTSNNPWEHSWQGDGPVKGNKWGNFGNGSRCHDQHDPRKLNNSRDACESSFIKHIETPKSGGWADRGCRDGGTNSWGWKQRVNYGKKPQNPAGGWVGRNDGYWKRGGSQRLMAGYKSTRFQGDHHPAHS